MALLGWLLGGSQGVVLLVSAGVFMFLFSPIATPRLVMRMYRAVRLPPSQAPGLHEALGELARRADLRSIPALYYLPSQIPNAFTVGDREQAAIAVTDGLLRALTPRETVAVLAHEVGHIQNNDIRVMVTADLFSRLTALLSLFGQFLLLINLPLILVAGTAINWLSIAILILSPTLSALAQLGLSRSREYEADLAAARITGDPTALASALLKIEHRSGSWLERLLLPGRHNPAPSLLRTHPPTRERVRRLLALQPPRRPLPLRYPVYPISHGLPTAVRRPRWHLSGLWY